MLYDNAIHKYYSRLQDLKQAGARTEGHLRKAFENLLDDTGQQHGMLVMAEVTEAATKRGKARNIRYDGKIMRKGTQVPHGYWEAKDRNDSLLHEVVKKKEAGYKFFNIIFEDTQDFILYQNDEKVFEGSLSKEKELAEGLDLFYSYKNQYEDDYIRALENFKASIPALAQGLHQALEELSGSNLAFVQSVKELHSEFAKFNSGINLAAIHEFIVQHTLTIDLFRCIFKVNDFEKLNPIAKLLDSKIMGVLQRHKAAIEEQTSALLRVVENVINQGYSTPSDKQKILIAIYEEFFKAYNPKKADTHGIVYTPVEIVDFMIASCDQLLHQHFGRRIHEDGVRILDPCTGTGTFVTGLINYMPQQYAVNKFQDIYAIEVDLMAYYMAQMNIEDALREKMGHKYIIIPFQNLALADTLEIGTLDKSTGRQAGELFEASYATITEQNAQLVGKLQASDFLLIMGNPPYNANQQSENENNRNKRYDIVDRRCTETYKANSNAQKMKLTDMYIRFFRWASDKLLHKHLGNESGEAAEARCGAYEKNSQGAMLSFISNRSYIDKLFTDGIRKSWQEEWDYVYIVDLLADVRNNPKIAGTTHNVFGIQTGVAICFLLKDSQKQSRAKVFYGAVPSDFMLRKERLNWLVELENIVNMQQQGCLQEILPDDKGNWLRQGERDFAQYMSIGDKDTKATREGHIPTSIFQLYSLGVVTARDEWVYDFSQDNLQKKIQFFIQHYEEKRIEFWEVYSEERREALLNRNETGTLAADQNQLQEWLGEDIKWTRELKERDFLKNHAIGYNDSKIIDSIYRPFVKQSLYYDSEYRIIHEKYKTHLIFGATGTLENVCIAFTNNLQIPISFQAIKNIPSLDILGRGSQLFPRYRYAAHSRKDILGGKIPQKIDNITGEALEYFQEAVTKKPKEVSKDHIFAYVYGLLHQGDYREKYADNLRNELPRIPVRPDFWELASLGQKLLDLHLNWDTEACPRKHYQLNAQTVQRPEKPPKTIKYGPKSERETGTIKISNALSLADIPAKAWDYTLGGRSAIDWVLEFYKESKNTYKDPSLARLVAEGKLEPYSLADYEDQLLDALERVINVSVETVELLRGSA